MLVLLVDQVYGLRPVCHDSGTFYLLRIKAGLNIYLQCTYLTECLGGQIILTCALSPKIRTILLLRKANAAQVKASGTVEVKVFGKVEVKVSDKVEVNVSDKDKVKESATKVNIPQSQIHLLHNMCQKKDYAGFEMIVDQSVQKHELCKKRLGT